MFPKELQKLLEGFGTTSEHVVITDTQGRIVYANPAAEVHTGFDRRDMIGKKPGELWGGHMSPEFYADMWETVAVHKQAYVGEMRNRRKDGTFYWQEVHIIPVIGADNDVQYLIGIELKVDDKEHREGLINACHSSKDTISLRGNFRVHWPLGWLFEKGNLSHAELLQLQETYADQNALDALTNDLLTISHIAFVSKVPDEDFCACSLLREVLQEIEEKFPDRQYDLRYDESTCLIHENKRLLYLALERIIANAAQYTKPDSGSVIVLLLRTRNQCVVRVEDDGIGIAFSEQKRIFDKFYRSRHARNLHPSGSGLGLYLVKTIADIRGWRVSCTSEPNQGSCFEVKIPLGKKVPPELALAE